MNTKRINSFRAIAAVRSRETKQGPPGSSAHLSVATPAAPEEGQDCSTWLRRQPMVRSRPCRRASAFVTLPCVLLLGCATNPASGKEVPTATVRAPGAQPLRLVHMDHVSPEKLRQFEQARLDWVAALAAKGLDDHRGAFFQRSSDNTFFTFIPIDTLASLDHRGWGAPTPGIDPAVRQRYDRLADDSLLPPHHSEIWLRWPELDYKPATGCPDEFAAGYARMVVELIDPRKEDDYELAWKGLIGSLEKAHYPLSRIFIYSQYGSGNYITLWLAHTREELLAAPPFEDAARSVLGSQQFEKLLRLWKGALASSETYELRARPDFGGP